MTIALRVLVIALGAVFTVYVFRLLTKRKLSEKNSLAWLAAAVVILVISIFPGILNALAALCGIDYPPALLFLVSTLLLLVIALHNSVEITALNEQIKELTQHLAVFSDDREKDAVKTL